MAVDKATHAADSVFWSGNACIGIGILVSMAMGKKDVTLAFVVLCQCIVAYAPFSVMTVRATKDTNFRPGDAKTLEEEFAVYGYPTWFYWLIRVLKPALAVSLLVGLVYAPALLVGASGILVLMIGAVGSHIKVKDPPLKSVPSATLGFLCICMLAAYFTDNAQTTQPFGELVQTGNVTTYADINQSDLPASLASVVNRWVFLLCFSAAFASMLAISIRPGLEDVGLWCGNLGMSVAVVVSWLQRTLINSNDAAGIVVVMLAIVALVPFSVMTIRATQETPFRPPGATNLQEELEAYGYPSWFCPVFRLAKSCTALAVATGILWTPALLVGVGGILVFMICAVASHIKVRDPPQKSVPSGTLVVMCIVILLAHSEGWLDGSTDAFCANEGFRPPAVFATTSGRRSIFVVVIGLCLMMVTHMGASVAGAIPTTEKNAPLLSA